MNSKYFVLVFYLEKQGVNFKRDVYQLNQSELCFYDDLAKEFGYKKPTLHSRGFGFYLLLQKAAENMHSEDITKRTSIELNIHRVIG